MALACAPEALAGILFYFVTISSLLMLERSFLSSIYIILHFSAFSLTGLVKPK